MYIVIVCQPDCDLINFEMNIIFLIKSFYLPDQMWRQKTKYIENERAFKMKEKAFLEKSPEKKNRFHQFLKGFH